MIEFAGQLRRSFFSVISDLWAGHPHFNYFVGISAGVAGILCAMLPSEAIIIATIEALLIIAYPIVLVGWRMTWERSEDMALPPQIETRHYFAIPYSATSDQDMLELSAFAAKAFRGDTIPGPLLLQAVRNGSVIGLRLTNEDRRANLGFLDVIHFCPKVMKEWLSGEVEETKLTLDDFEPVGPAGSKDKPLDVAMGALYLKPGIHTRNHHVPSAFVAAGLDHFRRVCAQYKDVDLYATIFSKPGDDWAKRVGFKLFQKKETRKGAAAAHDVYVLRLSAAPRVFDTVIATEKTFASIADFGGGRVTRYEVELDD